MKKYDAFFAGQEKRAYRLFGSHPYRGGVRFTLYAPHAYRVSCLSSFDNWHGEYFFRKIDERGVWRLFIPNIRPIYSYRYRLYKNEKEFQDRIDPYAYCFERRPATAACMYDLNYYTFQDSSWQKRKEEGACSIYELHLNSFWKEGALATLPELEKRLIPYLLENGFTHVEIMPIFEHPLDASWGYQASGFYGVTSRYGTPYDFMQFIDHCHQAGIGVFLDVVYAHFVADEFALAKYDFAPVYEYQEAHLQRTEWGSYYFSLYQGPVISFLMSSAFFYIDRYHVDGLRFDAVSHFIYHQGSTEKGLNVEGLSFIKRLNYALKKSYPKVLLMAEDSSAYPQVTTKVEEGGLGFDYKWDLGWMNDTLRYYSACFAQRKNLHHLITFSMYYFYSEHFLLPLSHDEVVHGKKTIIDKMYGNYQQKFSGCRNLFVYMFTHPGKKLNFMGNELAHFREFDENKSLDWSLLQYPQHQKFQHFFRDLNHLYKSSISLSQSEYDIKHFHWIDCNNADQSIFSYYREVEQEVTIVILNMKDIAYDQYRIGIPYSGIYQEILNSEWQKYGGTEVQQADAESEKIAYHGLDYSLSLRIAPYAGIVLRYRK